MKKYLYLDYRFLSATKKVLKIRFLGIRAAESGGNGDFRLNERPAKSLFLKQYRAFFWMYYVVYFSFLVGVG